MTDTNQLTITHPDLPGAIFQPRPDTDGHSVAYWGAHLFMGGRPSVKPSSAPTGITRATSWTHQR